MTTIRQPQQGETDPHADGTTSLPAALGEIQTEFQRASHQDVFFRNPSWVARFHVHHRSVDQVRKCSAFLAGDASHFHGPVGAQGISTGLQDAAKLAWKLYAVLRARSSVLILDTYQSERTPINPREQEKIRLQYQLPQHWISSLSQLPTKGGYFLKSDSEEIFERYRVTDIGIFAIHPNG